MNIDDFNPLILNVGKAVHYADWNWNEVCSPFARIYYIVSGKATVEIFGEKRLLRPGKMYLIPSFAVHTTDCKDSFVHYYVHIYEEGMVGHSLFDKYDLPFEVESQSGDEQLFERLSKLNPSMSLLKPDPQEYDNDKTLKESIAHNRQRSEWLKMESRGIVYQICSRFMMNASAKSFTKDKRIFESMNFIHANLTQHITTEQLANMVSLSPEHFIRLFNKIIGTTPMQYINQKRIEKAQLLMLTTDLHIKNIALSLGYTDNSYFVRVFKRIVGTTPMEYRKLSKN